MGRCLPFHLATVPLGGVQRLSLCIAHYVEASASYPATRAAFGLSCTDLIDRAGHEPSGSVLFAG